MAKASASLKFLTKKAVKTTKKKAQVFGLVPRSTLVALKRALLVDQPELLERAEQVKQGLALFMIEPMRDRILVLRADPRKKIGGIIIPDIAQETQGVGIVVAVGTGHYEHGVITPLEIHAGQIVYFSKYGGIPIKVGDQELVQLREEEIQTKAG